MSRILLLLLLACSPTDSLPETQEVSAQGDLDALALELRAELDSRGIKELIWAITPFRGEGDDANPYTALVATVSQRLDIPIRLRVGSDYEDLETQIATGEVDLGVLGPYSYVRTHERAPGIQVFASHISRGNVTYGAYIISRANSDIDRVEDLRGTRFAFVDQRSASGWLFPAARLLDAGIHPRDDLEPTFMGNHEKVVRAVLSGEADAGATYSDVLLDQQRTGSTELHIVAKGALVPHDAYVLRAGLPPIVGQAVGQALSEISTRDERGRGVLSALRPINGFIAVDDSHYERVRTVDMLVQTALEMP